MTNIVFGTGGRFGRLDDSLAVSLFDYAFQCGITHFDTGYEYCGGWSQKKLLHCVNNLDLASQKTISLSTKFSPDLTSDAFLEQVESVLNSLPSRPYIDTLFLWGPSLHQLRDATLLSPILKLLSEKKIF